jgi:hypothetical protein
MEKKESIRSPFSDVMKSSKHNKCTLPIEIKEEKEE